MFSFPFQSFQLLASKAETITMSLTFIVPRSKQPLALPSHARSFSFSLEGAPTRFGLPACAGRRGLCGCCQGGAPPCGVYGAEANVAHSVLSQCFSSLGPTVLLGGRAELNLHTIGLVPGSQECDLHLSCPPVLHIPAPCQVGPASTTPYSLLPGLKSPLGGRPPSPLPSPQGSLQPPYLLQSRWDPARRTRSANFKHFHSQTVS